ncbi:MAG: hypothetical protein AABW80_05475 [Nanoarchaeota archaeon]
MAQEKQHIEMPGPFGGIMRYDSEYKSKFMLSPMQVIGFIILILIFIVVLKVFFPVVDTNSGTGVSGLILSLLG